MSKIKNQRKCLQVPNSYVNLASLKMRYQRRCWQLKILGERLKQLREEYPPGTMVELVEMLGEPRKDMVSGLRGEIMFIDDAGGAHIRWQNGSTLACLHGIDRFVKVED